jgi:hypothetical protein
MATALPGILKACGLFNMIMGSINVAYGQSMLAGPSVFITGSASSALADSQIRYLGAIMASSGAVIWWTSYDILQRQLPLAMLGAGVFVGGGGRCGWSQARVWAEDEVGDVVGDGPASNCVYVWQCGGSVVGLVVWSEERQALWRSESTFGKRTGKQRVRHCEQ